MTIMEDRAEVGRLTKTVIVPIITYVLCARSREIRATSFGDPLSSVLPTIFANDSSDILPGKSTQRAA